MPNKKYQITEKQRLQFNRMLTVLKNIAKGYQTPDQLKRNCDKQYGLEYEETLEMAYENIQSDAASGSKGIKALNAPHSPNQ